MDLFTVVWEGGKMRLVFRVGTTAIRNQPVFWN